MKFEIESVGKVEDEIRGLIKAHWDEVALNKDAIPLEPDWETYRILEKIKKVAVLTARDDGILVGYYVSIIYPHLHYKSSLTAFCDLFYLKPEYRRGRNALRLFQAHEKAMKALGVQRILTMHKVHVNEIGNLLMYIGYKHVENVYSKVLEA